MTPFEDKAVEAAFTAMPPDARSGCLRLRQLIFDTAKDLPNAQPLEETLKWGQPAYLAPKGSTIRLGTGKDQGFALYVHCQSRLIPEFKETFPGLDRIEGTRALLFGQVEEIDTDRHGWLVARALTYHVKRTKG